MNVCASLHGVIKAPKAIWFPSLPRPSGSSESKDVLSYSYELTWVSDKFYFPLYSKENLMFFVLVMLLDYKMPELLLSVSRAVEIMRLRVAHWAVRASGCLASRRFSLLVRTMSLRLWVVMKSGDNIS